MSGKIGYDIEFFVKEIQGDKILFPEDSLIDVFNEAKSNTNLEARLERDGVAFELNNIPPMGTAEELDAFFYELCGFYREIEKAGFKPLGVSAISVDRLTCLPGTEEAMQQALEEIGCRPFYVPQEGKMQVSPVDMGGYRYAGFHIHVDLPPSTDRELFAGIAGQRLQALHERTCMLGMLSRTFMQRSRTAYAKPGAFRMRPFGVELRQLPGGAGDVAVGLQHRASLEMLKLSQKSLNSLLQGVI